MLYVLSRAFRAVPRSPLLLLLLCLSLYGASLTHDLPYVTHPDEPKVILRAIAMGAGDLNPHYFVYPSLWIYLVFLAQGIGLSVGLALGLIKSTESVPALVFLDPTLIFLAGRLLAVAFALGTVWMTWRIGRRISLLCGWIAALAVGLFPAFVWQAHFATPDMAQLFLILLCLYVATSVTTKGQKALLSAAAIGGLAVSVKYNAFVLLVALGAGSWFLSESRPRFRTWIARLFLTCGVMLAAFLLTSPFIVLDTREFLRDMHELYRNAVSPFQSSVFSIFYLRVMVKSLGIPFLVCSAVGWLAVLMTGEPKRRRTSAIYAAFALAYLCLIQSAGCKLLRYLLPVIPALAHGVGICVHLTWGYLGRRQVGRGMAIAAVAVMVGASLLPSLKGTMEVEKGLRQESNAALVVKWFAKNVPVRSAVLVDSETGVRLPPDRASVEERIAGWVSDGSGRAMQLVKAYRMYLDKGYDKLGYRIMSTHARLLNTFQMGYDVNRDFDPSVLDSLDYIVTVGRALALEGRDRRSLFYGGLKQDFSTVFVARQGTPPDIVVLERERDVEATPGQVHLERTSQAE